MKERKRNKASLLFLGCIFLLSAGSMPALAGNKVRSTADHLKVFTDNSCSELIDGITSKEIAKLADPFYRDIATALMAGNYPGKEFRIQEYRPYQTPKQSSLRTKTMHTWGILDNATGIYVANPGDELHILVGDTKGQSVKLRVQDYTSAWATQTFDLSAGHNVLKPGAGLCYILIHQDEYIPLHPGSEAEKDYLKDKSVKVHFVTGKVNGYYHADKHTSQDSPTLLSRAGYDFFDVIGKYTQLVWYTEDFLEAGADLSKTIEKLDLLVGLEIDFAGFFKYGKPYSTRMFFMPSATGKGNPNATVERVIFPRSYKNFFAHATDETFKSRVWGLAHEVGHCSQSNPGMRWGGMGEVGNNLFSLYVKTAVFGFEQSNLLLEGYYEKARTIIIEAGLAHADSSITRSKHFERLVPFWQLHLYLAEARGYKDFYRDLYEHYRTNPDIGTTFKNSGLLQLDFVRNACNLSQTNLLDFFKAWGFLTPIDVVVNDYGGRTLKISRQDIDQLVSEIEAKGYPKPEKDITTIRDDNFESFRKPAI